MSDPIFNIELGQEAEDVVTGYKGVVVARCEFIDGCVQYCLLPKSVKGKYPDNQYIDEARLEVIETKPKSVESSRTGGPHADAPPPNKQC